MSDPRKEAQDELVESRTAAGSWQARYDRLREDCEALTSALNEVGVELSKERHRLDALLLHGNADGNIGEETVMLNDRDAVDRWIAAGCKPAE